MVRRWGFDRLWSSSDDGTFLPGDDPTADASWMDYQAAFNEFFARWRLRGLAARSPPIPLEPLRSPVLCQCRPWLNSRGPAVSSVCRTRFQASSRDTLRNLLDDALHRSGLPEHLN